MTLNSQESPRWSQVAAAGSDEPVPWRWQQKAPW